LFLAFPPPPHLSNFKYPPPFGLLLVPQTLLLLCLLPLNPLLPLLGEPPLLLLTRAQVLLFLTL
jgi:hypothetical protein